MKLFVLITFTLIFVQYSNCQDAWLPQKFMEVVKGTANYVKDKGRSLKDKISSYFQADSKEIGTESQQEPSNEESKIRSFFNKIRFKKSDKPRNFDKSVGVVKNIGVSKSLPSEHSVIDAIELEKRIFNKSETSLQRRCDSDVDPTIHLTTPQLIALHGYPAQSHTVVTEDGYILTIHRIPFSKRATNNTSPHKTVLLHHGLLGSSADWVISGPQNALAFILSDAGYDVWLANVRGNTYSKAHISWSVDSSRFWNFTFHEVSQYDLPAVIDYIMFMKGAEVKINYIGHSMGTTVLFAMLSTKTQYNKILRAGFALAPVAYMTNIRSPIKYLANYVNNLEKLFKLIGLNQFMPSNYLVKIFAKYVCEKSPFEISICENSLFYICGRDEQQFNKSLLPILLAHVPAGASSKTLVHYAQEIHNSGNFQQYDYGTEGNKIKYGTETPPQYQLHKITLPIALFSSENDWLAGEVDVSNLYIQLANPLEHYRVPLKEFNHIDFLWAIDARTLVYDKLLSLLQAGIKSSSNELISKDFLT